MTPPNTGAVGLTVLCLAPLIVMIDTTVVSVALPTLVRDLGASNSQLPWIVRVLLPERRQELGQFQDSGDVGEHPGDEEFR